MSSTIVQNIDAIRFLFQEVKAFCEQENDLENIIGTLDQSPKDFISIAYEGASMVLALRDFSESMQLVEWTKFAQHPHAQQHLAQVYVGLGWAVAQEQIKLDSLLEQLPSFWGTKTADGSGYYDGIFRHRQTIRGLELPKYISKEALPVYDQGLGRSLWYLTKGVPEQTKNLLFTFPKERHSDLWRGVGLACAYVGGVEESTLQALFEEARDDKKSLIIGGLLAMKARFEAQCMTENAELCIRVWSKKTASLLQDLFSEEEKKNKTDSYSYFDYLKQIELSLKP